MSGYLGDLSPAQESALSSLKDLLSPEIQEHPFLNDTYLLRFLRSRQFDLEKTEAKLRATLDFKRQYGAFTILEDYTPPPLLKKYFPAGFLPGLAKDGRVLNLLCMGNIDPKGFLKSFSREEIIRFKIYIMETVENRIRTIASQTGKAHDTVYALLDLEGLSTYHLWMPGIQLITDLMEIDERHYPELAQKVIVLRAPMIFPTIFALLRGFIDPVTRQKIEIPSPSKALEVLLEVAALEDIPEVFGGTLKETPEASWGGRIPVEFYRENRESLIKCHVKPGMTFCVDVKVEKVPQQLTWEFVTENYDIGFSVLHNNTPVVPSQRSESNAGMIEGSYTCEQPGTYVLAWDNSFSWTRGKNLKYSYSLVDSNSKP